MENEPWDSALFELKPAKFYLCPFKRHGKLADFLKIVLKIYILVRGFNAHTEEEQMV